MDVLKLLYPNVCSLGDWIKSLGIDWLTASLLADGDPPAYKSLLETTLVGLRGSVRTDWASTSLSQHSYQREIILRIVKRVLEREGAGSNVITKGFSLPSDDRNALVCSLNVEWHYPNSITSRLQGKPWNTLLSRLGDEVMEYLLERFSLFSQVSPTCYVQLTGKPVYDLWGYGKGSVLDIASCTRKRRESEANIAAKRQNITAKARPGKRKLPLETCPEGEIPVTKKRRRKKKKATEKCQTTSASSPSFRPFDHVLSVDKKRMLYNRNVRERFPKQDGLSVLKPTSQGALSLYQAVFINTSVHCSPVPVSVLTPAEGSNTTEDGVDCRQENQPADSQTSNPATICVPAVPTVLPHLEKFLVRFRSCPYKLLLKHHCPVKNSVSQRNSSLKRLRHRGRKYRASSNRTPVAAIGTLLGDHVQHRQVFLFLRAVVLKTVPVPLFGSSHNRNVMLKNVSRLVSLGKFDSLCLGELMQGVKTTDCDWLMSLPSNTARRHLLAKFVFWLFSSFITLLMKTYFYITDTAQNRNGLIYYRQCVWNTLYASAFSDLIFEKKILEAISGEKFRSLQRTGKTLGVATLRFLPKQKSLRPIFNMGNTSPSVTNMKISINRQLWSLRSVLSYIKVWKATSLSDIWNGKKDSIKETRPEALGCGKLGMDDIYKSWRDFAQSWKARGQPKLYFVKTDISDCYDTILQRKLHSIVEGLINQVAQPGEQLVLRRYGKLNKVATGVRRSFVTSVSSLSSFTPDFIDFITDEISQCDLHSTILVDKVVHQHETAKSLLHQLEAHLFNNIVKVGCNHYLHTEGISQGSVISTLLCGFYYAQMEREMFSVGAAELLMRLVDDFLLVTPSLENAMAFLDTMLKGVPEYNCKTNSEKILTNFPYMYGSKTTNQPQKTDWFPWCGLLLNTETLEVCVDYSRYAGISIADTMSYKFSNKPGKAMKAKLIQSIRPKCHYIFLDTQVNTPEQIVRNCYLMFMLAAFKFHAYAQKLPYKQRVEDNPAFFLGMLTDMVSYVCCQVQKMSKKCQGQKTDFLPHRPVIKWLCMKAFHVKMKRHQSQYTKFLRSITAEMAVTRPSAVKEFDSLDEICGDGIPEQFLEVLN